MNNKLVLSGLIGLTWALSAFSIQSEVHAAEKWNYICSDPNQKKSCRIEQKLFLKKEIKGQQKQVGKLLNIAVLYSGTTERKPYIVMQLPLGVDLRAGMVLKVDKAKELKAPYLKCTNAGCEVQSLLTDELLAQLQRGRTMKVGFRAFGATKTMVVEADLTGFSKAYSKLF